MLFETLFGTAQRRPPRLRLVLYGLFCATIAVGAWVTNMGIGSIAIFGVLAVGNFVLAARKPLSARAPGGA
jgi:hypothetical protein